MNEFKKIASSLVKKGDSFIRENGVKKFHLEASELLGKANLHKVYDYQEIVDLAFNSSSRKIEQNFASLEFSDLPLTIARGKDCFIDLYFWRRRPTVIHNHHFTGAFQCLVGSNVDLEFEFIEKKKFGKYHSTGDVRVVKTHEVKAGDIQPIAPLDKFIHQNHHHADLTVNLCFRTADIQKNHLSNYLYSGFKYEKNPPLLARAEKLLRFTQLEKFDFKSLELDLDDALAFLVRTDRIETQNKIFLDLHAYLKTRVKKETGLNITKLFDEHESILNKLQDQYN